MVEVSKDGLRDVYEVANQLAGYVGPDTPNELARFLVRESNEAARLGDRVNTLQAERDRYRVALEGLLSAGKAGSWSSVVEHLVARFDVAAKFGGDAVHNSDGSAALAELLRSMADKLDHACTTARTALSDTPTVQS